MCKFDDEPKPVSESDGRIDLLSLVHYCMCTVAVFTTVLAWCLHFTDASDSEDEEELQSESGLGESPEEDLIEDTGHPLSDDEEEEEKEDNSDSDAPEDMGFMANQQAEKKMMQSILDEIRKGKNEKKNKRRMKDEMFKMQKVRQLQTMRHVQVVH